MTDRQPAIRRSFGSEDRAVEVLDDVGKNVRFQRGLGEIGTRVEKVAHDCPRCGHDEMYRGISLHPDGPDGVEYYCARFQCPHFVGTELDSDAGMTERRACSGGPGSSAHDYPEVFDVTVECPDCDEKREETVSRGQSLYDRVVSDDSGGLVTSVCGACLEQQTKNLP